MLVFPPDLRDALQNEGRDLTILVVRLGAMGDILRTLPPVRLIREALPSASIFWALERPWDILLRGHPDLRGLFIPPRDKWKAYSPSPRKWPALVGALRSFRGELAGLDAGLCIDFHGNLRSGLVTSWSRAEVRLGYAGHEQKEGNRLFTTHRVESGDRRTPRMERNLSLVRALGLADAPLPDGGLPLVADGRDAATEIVSALPASRTSRTTTRRFAVISPGASESQAYKKPPVELLAQACRFLGARDVHPLVVWGPGEEPDAEAVVGRSAGRATLSPATNLAALAALLSEAALFVGGDTGPLHMSCAVGCPVVGVYGPTDPQVNQPWGVPFRVVAPKGRHYTGIKRIDREAGGFDGLESAQVTRAIEELLELRPD